MKLIVKSFHHTLRAKSSTLIPQSKVTQVKWASRKLKATKLNRFPATNKGGSPMKEALFSSMLTTIAESKSMDKTTALKLKPNRTEQSLIRQLPTEPKKLPRKSLKPLNKPTLPKDKQDHKALIRETLKDRVDVAKDLRAKMIGRSRPIK
jgi:hypothetical protein